MNITNSNSSNEYSVESLGEQLNIPLEIIAELQLKMVQLIEYCSANLLVDEINFMIDKTLSQYGIKLDINNILKLNMALQEAHIDELNKYH